MREIQRLHHSLHSRCDFLRIWVPTIHYLEAETQGYSRKVMPVYRHCITVVLRFRLYTITVYIPTSSELKFGDYMSVGVEHVRNNN